MKPSPTVYYGYMPPKPKRAPRRDVILKFVRARAAWLMSTTVHVVLLLSSALIVIKQQQHRWPCWQFSARGILTSPEIIESKSKTH